MSGLCINQDHGFHSIEVPQFLPEDIRMLIHDSTVIIKLKGHTKRVFIAMHGLTNTTTLQLVLPLLVLLYLVLE